MSSESQKFLSSLSVEEFNVLKKMFTNVSSTLFYGKERQALEELVLRIEIEDEERNEKSFKEEQFQEK